MSEKEISEKWEEFKKLLKSTNREGIDNIIKWLDESDFKTAPASTQYHSSFKGGLLNHSLQVYYHMLDFQNLLDFFEISKETTIIVALLHDVCKVDTYLESTRNIKNEKGEWIQVPYYTVDEKIPYGHGEKSVMLLQYYGLKLTFIEIMMIRSHMGAFRDVQVFNEVSLRFSKCPQSLILHYADMLATYTTESKDLQNRFKEKLLGNNINNSLKELSKPKTIIIDEKEYIIAPDNAIVDNINIVEKIISDSNGKLLTIKVLVNK